MLTYANIAKYFVWRKIQNICFLLLCQVNESEHERLESELEHLKAAQMLNDAEQKVKKLQRDWKRNIAKSRSVDMLATVRILPRLTASGMLNVCLFLQNRRVLLSTFLLLVSFPGVVILLSSSSVIVWHILESLLGMYRIAIFKIRPEPISPDIK